MWGVFFCWVDVDGICAKTPKGECISKINSKNTQKVIDFVRMMGYNEECKYVRQNR